MSVWIGGRLDPLENLPPPVAVILITAVIAMFTEFASNTATIIIFLPVLAELVKKTSYVSFEQLAALPLFSLISEEILAQAVASNSCPYFHFFFWVTLYPCTWQPFYDKHICRSLFIGLGTLNLCRSPLNLRRLQKGHSFS